MHTPLLETYDHIEQFGYRLADIDNADTDDSHVRDRYMNRLLRIARWVEFKWALEELSPIELELLGFLSWSVIGVTQEDTWRVLNSLQDQSFEVPGSFRIFNDKWVTKKAMNTADSIINWLKDSIPKV